MLFKSILFGMLLGWIAVGTWFKGAGMATQSAVFIGSAVGGMCAWRAVAMAYRMCADVLHHRVEQVPKEA